jgi:hypothetical protein
MFGGGVYTYYKVILEKLTDIRIVKIFLAFRGTQRPITVFIRTCHWALS